MKFALGFYWMRLDMKTILIAVAILIAAACGAAADAPTSDGEDARASLEPIRGPVSEDGLQAIFATPDLGVGRHRVAFALTSRTGLIDAPSATVQSFYAPPEGAGDAPLGEPAQTALALFRPFPLVERGLYSTSMTFDRPGRWALSAAVLGSDGLPKRARLYFDVPERSRAPAPGSRAPISVSKTAADVDDLSQLTTGSEPDADLYRVSIADALKSGLPTVVVMASPAFCISAVCGPQVEVLSELKDEFAGQANFIHVDFYDNPDEIQGDLSRAVVSPTVLEWNLPSPEWTFVIGEDGAIADRFEGFATLEELRGALAGALRL